MERYGINQMPLPASGHDSYIRVRSSIFFMGENGYEARVDEENGILQTREKYETAAKKLKAPPRVPTIFRNHGDRGTFLGIEHRRLKLDPKDPPEELFVIFTFAEEVYSNILINFSKDYPEGKQKPYLLHDKPAKVVCLRQEYSAEDAFEEALSANPLYYADDIEVVKKSPYVDPNDKKWRIREGCMAEYSRIEDNEIQFNVDFSLIYPENIWSTAFVVCYDCGKTAETTLCDAVKEEARSEIWHNIVRYNIEKKVSERERYVIRLPMTNSLHTLCSFREGLMGFTPLTQSRSGKPSLYVRVRLTFYTNEESQIGPVLHNHKWRLR